VSQGWTWLTLREEGGGTDEIDFTKTNLCVGLWEGRKVREILREEEGGKVEGRLFPIHSLCFVYCFKHSIPNIWCHLIDEEISVASMRTRLPTTD
jgi:hypothetical protein